MRFETYKDKAGWHRWRLVSNGNTIADSAESYKNRTDMAKGIALVKGSSEAEIVDLPDEPTDEDPE